jgi:dTDP-D-glucose 4,6-dehydratase
MFDSGILLGAIVGSHVYTVVQLPEALLPRIVRVALISGHKLELTGRGVHQRCVIFKHRLIQAFPDGHYNI